MDKKIRVLVITYLPWRNDNNVGNSYSNIFCGMDDKIEFAQLYIKDGMPENELAHQYFCISEKKLFKSVITRKDVGESFYLDNPLDTPVVQFSNVYNRIRGLRWNVFLLGRDVGSALGKWKTNQLDKFLSDFKPDIIFGTLGFVPVINKIMIYAKRRTQASLILYPWDDWYHINHKTLSPFYYMRIFYERRYIRKATKECSYMYTITEQMKKAYTQLFKKKCKVLTKGYDFSTIDNKPKEISDTIKLVYTGNIGDKRWEVLEKIASCIANINKQSDVKFHQYIYTLSPISDELKKCLNIEDSSSLMGAVRSSEVPDVLKQADILVHVESTDKAKIENCRFSFSTKLVDYFHHAKCILAVGGQNASMIYLKENDAAIVVSDLENLDGIFTKLATNRSLISEYSLKAWECGKRNHSIEKIQSMIYKDFLEQVKTGEKKI